MKRTLTAAILLAFASTAANAAVTKLTFTNVTFSDGQTGTIHASVKTTKSGTVTLCDYSTNPNDQSAGQFQGTDNTATDGAAVQAYCLAHFAERTPSK